MVQPFNFCEVYSLDGVVSFYMVFELTKRFVLGEKWNHVELLRHEEILCAEAVRKLTRRLKQWWDT